MIITELFATFSADAVAVYRLEITVFEGVGNFGRKFQVEEDIPHQPFVHG